MIGSGTLINMAAILLGCLFSAIPVGIFQGSVTLLARLIAAVFGIFEL